MSNNKRTGSNEVIEKAPMKQRVLILAGVMGPIIYILNVMLGGIITPNYSHIENAVSELTQRGSPNIVVLSALFVLSTVLILFFGIAIMMRFQSQSRRVYTGGVMIVVYGIFAALLASIFPQDPIGGESTFPGTMHLVLAGLTAFLIMGLILLIGLGMDQRTGRSNFKLYSIITVILVFVFGASTPILIMKEIELLGLFERITQLAYLQWFVVFATYLLQQVPTE
ncbi:MAG: DUF998 domain-containing protein [Bacteroidales bacterium]|nr:DUF998 domain-containing protein [Bacteroidales bacterium]